MGDELFVPEDFAVPDGLIAGEFRLAPLGPQHNEADYAAWTASIDHIRATPGFPDGRWPHEMSLGDNLRDLERHAQDFAERRGFTYTVLSTGTGDVVGCVYIYPASGHEPSGSAESRRRVPRSCPCPGALPARRSASKTQGSSGAAGRASDSARRRSAAEAAAGAGVVQRSRGGCTTGSVGRGGRARTATMLLGGFAGTTVGQ